jgi:hypothetical protein
VGLFPKWLKEFPSSFIETYKEAIPENWQEFKKEVAEGSKTIFQVPGKVIAEVIKPLQTPLILIGVIALLLLIFWKRIVK